MQKSYSYLIGLAFLSIFLAIVKTVIGLKILDIVDVFTPFYNPSQYYVSFFDLWKNGNSGGIGNAPISMLYGAVLSAIGLSSANIQFAIFCLLIFFDYSALFLLISYLAKDKNVLALIFSFFLLFIEFQWAGFIYATALNFFLAFAPFIIYFSLRMFQSEISTFKSIVFIALSLIGASFGIAEAFPYSLFIYFPVLMAAFIDDILINHNYSTLLNFIKRQLTFLAGLLLGLGILIYSYYPWILGAIGLGSSYASSLASSFTNTNIFIGNSFSSLGTGATMVGLVFALRGSYATIFGLVFILIFGSYAFTKRKNTVIMSAYIFIVLLVTYIQIAISFPIQLFQIITFIPILRNVFITINEPAEMFYIIVIWVYFLVGSAIFDLVENYDIISKFVQTRIIKLGIMAVNNNPNTRRELKFGIYVVFIVVTLLLFSTSVNSISTLASGNAGYTPYGNYQVPNYIPGYVHNIYNITTNNSVHGYQKTLFLPDYPRVERWEQTSPYFYNFPPSNIHQMSLFTSFVHDIQNHNEIGTGKLLGQLNIGYIAIVNALNQSETGPRIAYDNFNQPYAILGNPLIFYSYFINSPDYKLISNNRNYSIFENLNNSGTFQIYRGAAILSDNTQKYILNDSFNLNVPPESTPTLNSSIASVNLLNNITQNAYWTPLGNNISEETQNSTIIVGFKCHLEGFSTSYFSEGFPVSAGMSLKFSSEITSINDSISTYYDGFDCAFSNESIVPGHYWQNGIYHLMGNERALARGVFTVPNNVSYVLPWFTFQNATGHFIISNLSITVIHAGYNFSFPFSYVTSKNALNLTARSLNFTIESLFPNTDLVSINNLNNISGISSVNVSVYNGTTPMPGLYIAPVYYLFHKYGYVWGNGDYSVLNPGSFEEGNLSLKDGEYSIAIKISGGGFGVIEVNNHTYLYNTIPTGATEIRLNIEVHSGVSVLIRNIIGQINLYDIVLVGPNLSNELKSIITGALPEPVYTMLQNTGQSMISLNISTNEPVIVVMKENYNDGWSLSYEVSGVKHEEKPILINGYEMAFILPIDFNNLTLIFIPPRFMVAQIYITAISLPSFLSIALLTTIIDRRKRGVST